MYSASYFQRTQRVLRLHSTQAIILMAVLLIGLMTILSSSGVPHKVSAAQQTLDVTVIPDASNPAQ